LHGDAFTAWITSLRHFGGYPDGADDEVRFSFDCWTDPSVSAAWDGVSRRRRPLWLLAAWAVPTCQSRHPHRCAFAVPHVAWSICNRVDAAAATSLQIRAHDALRMAAIAGPSVMPASTTTSPNRWGC